MESGKRPLFITKGPLIHHPGKFNRVSSSYSAAPSCRSTGVRANGAGGLKAQVIHQFDREHCHRHRTCFKRRLKSGGACRALRVLRARRYKTLDPNLIQHGQASCVKAAEQACRTDIQGADMSDRPSPPRPSVLPALCHHIMAAALQLWPPIASGLGFWKFLDHRCEGMGLVGAVCRCRATRRRQF